MYNKRLAGERELLRRLKPGVIVLLHLQYCNQWYALLERYFIMDSTKNTRRILILSANPINTNRLRLDEEIREIEEGLRRSNNRGRFVIHHQQAVRLRDLRRTMLEYTPQIVHFCGHGEGNGIMVEDEHGKAILVDPVALTGLFELFKEQVECVVLNACYSEIQADAVSKHINYVIGMNAGIQDKTAIEFALGFYDALGVGKTIEEAFKFGQNAIQLYSLQGHLIPILKKNSVQLSHIAPNNTSDQKRSLQEQSKKELEEEYDVLSRQLHRVKMDKHIETDTLTRFKLEKQIERIETDLENLDQLLRK